MPNYLNSQKDPQDASQCRMLLEGATTFTITALSRMTSVCFCVPIQLRLSTIMLSVVILSVVQQSVIMLTVTILRVVMLSVVVLSVVVLSVVMLNVVVLSVIMMRVIRLSVVKLSVIVLRVVLMRVIRLSVIILKGLLCCMSLCRVLLRTMSQCQLTMYQFQVICCGWHNIMYDKISCQYIDVSFRDFLKISLSRLNYLSETSVLRNINYRG